MTNGACSRLFPILLTFLSLAHIDAGAQCLPPSPPSILTAPSDPVDAGRTYAITWSSVDGALYLVERSVSSNFANPESVLTAMTASSFTTDATGTRYHRVRALAACDPTLESAVSQVAAVDVVAGLPLVVFSAHPAPVLIATGQDLSTVTSHFAIENLGTSATTVALTAEPIAPSGAFFTIEDPDGGNVSALLLEPRQPKRLNVRYTASTAARATHRGFISIAGAGAELATTPSAYLELKVGATSETATPQFRVDGVQTEIASFAGWPASQSDSTRPPLIIEIHNPGTTPLDLAGSIEPEGWLVPEAGWNADPVPAGSSIEVALYTDRRRAPAQAAYPRNTYFTVHSLAGKSARLLIEDHELVPEAGKRAVATAADSEGLIIPFVINLKGGGNTTFRSRVRIGNASGIPRTLELSFEPLQGSGPSVGAALAVPANDVVTFSDIVQQVFGLTQALGRIRIQAPSAVTDVLTVTHESYAPYASGGGWSANIPVLRVGEGASTGVPHVVSGSTPSNSRTNLLLSETSGTATLVDATLYGEDGALLGKVTIALPPWGDFQINSFQTRFGLPRDAAYGRLEIAVASETATVAAMLFVIDNVSAELYSLHVSSPIGGGVKAASTPAISVAQVQVIPGALKGTIQSPASIEYNTTIALTAAEAAADVTVSFASSAGLFSGVGIPMRVAAGTTVEMDDALDALFRIAHTTESEGTILIHSSSSVQVYGRVIAKPAGLPSYIVGQLPVVGSASEALTSARGGMQRPVFFDGLQQSLDPTRGTRWALALTEVSGARSTVNVRLYEPGERTAAIVSRDIELRPYENLYLDTVFSELGLDATDRRKERTNTLGVVTPAGGYGVVVAVAIEIDVRTGDRTTYLLTPNGGVPATGVSTLAPVALPVPDPSVRKRPVHP